MTRQQQEAMLSTVDVKSLDELFSAIPEELRLQKDLKLPEPLSEHELKKHMNTLAQRILHNQEYLLFRSRCL